MCKRAVTLCLPGSGTGEDGGLPACPLRRPSLCTPQTWASMTRLARAYVSPPSWALGATGWHLLPWGWGRPSVHQACPPGCGALRARCRVTKILRGKQQGHPPRSTCHVPLSSTERGGVVAEVLCCKAMHAVVILSPAATELKEN